MCDRDKDNKRASELLDLLLDDATDPKTKEDIRAWLWSNVSRNAKDIAMIELFRQMMPNMAPDEVDHKKYAELAKRPDMDGMTRIPVRKKRRISIIRTPVRIAAAVVLLLGLSGIVYRLVNDSPEAAPEPSFAEITVSAGQSARSITLPDGSSVELQAHSELTYNENFTSGRRVHLNGEALLTIAKSTNKAGESIPFSVTSDDLMIDVHGTVFRVIDPRDDHSSQSVVALYDGFVSVTANDVTTMLKYGQEYNYDNVTKESSVTLISADEMAGRGFKPLLHFEEANLGDIITSLKANYGVEFVLSEDIDLSRGKFSGDFNGEDLISVLNILTKSNARFNFVLEYDKVYITRK